MVSAWYVRTWKDKRRSKITGWSTKNLSTKIAYKAQQCEKFHQNVEWKRRSWYFYSWKTNSNRGSFLLTTNPTNDDGLWFWKELDWTWETNMLVCYSSHEQFLRKHKITKTRSTWSPTCWKNKCKCSSSPSMQEEKFLITSSNLTSFSNKS